MRRIGELFLHIRDFSHGDLIDLIKCCGYKVAGSGVCAGFTNMTLQALLSRDLLTYRLRLKFIEELIGTREYQALSSEIELKSPNEWVDIIQGLENKESYQEYKEHLNRIEKVINVATIASEMFSFCEGIATSQSPDLSRYKPWFEPHHAPRMQYPTTAPLVHSKILEEKRGSLSLGYTMGAYALSDIKAFIQRLTEIMSGLDVTCPIGFVIHSSSHRILLGFDESKQIWFIADSNKISLMNSHYPTCLSQGLAGCILWAFVDHLTTETAVLHIEGVMALADKEENEALYQAILDFLNQEKFKLLSGDLLDKKDSITGVTPLYIASRRGHTDMVNLLLEEGADPNAASTDGYTTLHMAAVRGYTDIANALLEKGADPNLAKMGDSSPLYGAIRKGHTDMAKLLLEKGADPNFMKTDNCTPLFLAAQEGRTPIVRLLLNHNCLFIPFKSSKDKLIKFAEERDVRDEMASFLHTKTHDPVEVTPLDIAIIMGHNDVVKLLANDSAPDPIPAPKPGR